jgi:RimJ/RimL family protein N-acetyltransferase
MAWTLTDDADRYAAAAGEFLERQPAANTILLTVAATLRARGADSFGGQPPLFGWWQDPDGKISGAFLQTPPYPVLVTTVEADAAAALASVLTGKRHRVPGVNADEETARQFAAAWHVLTGESARVHQRTRLYRLEELSPPDPAPPGAARVAGPADRGLLADWFTAFNSEAGSTIADVGKAVDDRLSYNGLTLWEVDAQPVSLAGLTRMVAGQVRVGPVYTPPQARQRGFAGAATAVVSKAALDAGAAEVLLFTDLANPTSNALYQRLGYRPVSDRVAILFEPR